MRAVLLSIALIFVSCTEAQIAFKNISKQDLQEVLKKEMVQLVDVRTQSEFDQGAIKGAVLVDYWSEGFISKISKQFDKTKPIYLYCKVGGRSSKAAKLLVESGFKEVYSLEGGYSEWSKK